VSYWLILCSASACKPAIETVLGELMTDTVQVHVLVKSK
jgi:hypothetical protein